MDKVDEFLVQNEAEIEAAGSSVPEVTEKTYELAVAQGCKEIFDLYNSHLLSARIAGYFGWCDATPESVEEAIKDIGEAVEQLPNYGYRPKFDDFVDQVSFKVNDSGHKASRNLPYAVFKDICRHYYK